MTTTLNHAPWDDGIFARTRDILDQKTIKTHCGKRVATSRAQACHPTTCPDCLQYQDDRRAALKACGIAHDYP